MNIDEPDYDGTIQRILSILKNDSLLEDEIAAYEYGEDPEEFFADTLPTIYVTLATHPEVSRENIAPATSINTLPTQMIVTEYWVVILVEEPTQEESQAKVYGLRDDVIAILERNIQLRDSDGNDPKCSKIDISSISRMSNQKGRVLEGMTIMVRAVNIKASPVP